MDVIGVEAGAAQPDRPAAVEPPVTTVPAAQEIVAATDLLEVPADRAREAREERPDDRVRRPGQVLRRLRPVPQGLEEEGMPVRIVQSIETDLELGEEAREVRPGRRRFELLRDDER